MTAAKKKAFVMRMAKARASAAARSPARPSRRAKKSKAKKPQTTAKAKRRAKPNGPALQSVLRDTKTRRNVKTYDTRKDALAIARRRNEFEGYKRYTVNNAEPRPKRRNPDEDMTAAEKMYEDFHGRPANRTVKHSESHEFRSSLAELGKLLELTVKIDGETKPVPVADFGNCQVTCTPDGTNIYFLGGQQEINLAHLGITSDKDYLEIGPCHLIRYYTKKGFHNFSPINYFHKFGEEDGTRPVLAYDAINRKLFLLGGNYQCRPEGIVN